MMKQKIDAHMIAIMGLLVALMVVLSQVLGFQTQFLKITFSFIPEVIMAVLFGPFWTGIGAGIADVIGNTLLAKAPFFIGFTLNAVIGGLVYGFFFYKKEITLRNAFLAVLTNTLLISLFLTPLWLSLMYNVPFMDWKIWSVRIMKALVMLPLETMIIYVVGRTIPYRRLAKRFI